MATLPLLRPHQQRAASLHGILGPVLVSACTFSPLCLNVYFDMISNIQKSCNNSLKGTNDLLCWLWFTPGLVFETSSRYEASGSSSLGPSLLSGDFAMLSQSHFRLLSLQSPCLLWLNLLEFMNLTNLFKKLNCNFLWLVCFLGQRLYVALLAQ